MRTKIHLWLIMLTLTAVYVFVAPGCREDETLPVLSKPEVSEITQTTAKVSRLIIADGGTTIEASGLVWGESENLMLESSSGKNNETITGGKITSVITGLIPGTRYFIRAYAVNKLGTAYTEPAEFSTKGIIQGNGVMDHEGNTYPTVVLGDQEWMAANLKTSNFNDGTPVTNVASPAEWVNLNTGAMCWYDNDQAVWAEAYGALYNWFVVQSGKICPQGWHIPSLNDWKKLSAYVGGDSIASERLRSGHAAPANHPRWDNSVRNSTDAFGFAAQPGGGRIADPWNNSRYISLGTEGYWWSSSENTVQNTGAWFVQVGNTHPDWSIKWAEKSNGLAIRCIKSSD